MVLSLGSLTKLLAASTLGLVIAGSAAAQSAGGGASGGAGGGGTAASSGSASTGTSGPSIQGPSTGSASAPANSASSVEGESVSAAPAPAGEAGAATDMAVSVPDGNAAPTTVAATPEAEAQARQRMQDACMTPPAKLASDEIDAFLASPTNLLTTYGAQSLTLSNRVRTLAGSDGRTLDPIFASISNASDDQKAAIGAGLGRAAFMCQGINPDYAAEIQSRIADLDAPALLSAFLTATNDLQVAAIGGAGAASGAGSPGLSGGGLAGPGTAGLGGDDTVANLITAYASSGGGTTVLGSDGDSSSSLTINIFNGTSVSPTGAN